MIKFELLQLFSRRKWRWVIIGVVIACMNLLMIGTGAQEQNLWSGLVTVFSQQFLSMIVMPCLFICLISDLILEDISNGAVGYTLPRSTSRFSWLVAKVISLFAAAITFTNICLFAYLAIGIILGLPLEKGWEMLLFKIPVAPAAVILTIVCSYIFTLTAFGMCILMLSILTRNVIVSWAAGALISVMGYMSWIYLELRPFNQWFPTAQMMFLSQIPNNITEDLFTIQWSIAYNIVLFVTSFLLSFYRIRKMNLSRKD